MTLAENSALRHVAIIMDGNGRWARKKLKPRVFGHRNSIASVDAAIEYCVENSIQILTLFAFGRDNWSRSPQEVSDLMDLFYKTLRDKTPKLDKNNIVLKVVGDRTRLSKKLLEKVVQSEDLTKDNTGLELRLAIDYSGSWDIVNAAKAFARDVIFNDLSIESLDNDSFGKYLVGGTVPVDLLIRTSGEVRLSDFMLWQLAYAEMYFTGVMWPDFSKKEMQEAVDYFHSRQRRFGKSGEQV
ncbi:di-trans,poly-cis-decaprenylcistransferase [Allofrancisella guangzhouensis]|uniref:Ditrans,polycis-undecaprenyl-diphosphate synthase ((2E,6E)-farnesyl-diphosphate specific) n=1 Tax=Allofrancisella guangzhouensis TaxID=594679 RepID=A0A0A8E8U8_9GAMM|nr:polyprenyl diphosphate synthase [Allofrancisella guangzhouensis]AJC48556.1 UDP pyrophosphate synthase [Allofrancisella guangzhouensis]MBK2027778.1 di-trans,poly-cis-decaprenylcistransferase [Allofrancisella guangzhouensis]MBK2043516.1 di-trans,poly-cis-decaprenylcistransferase [Allofrancisella guangzhouensis]MBK2045781.1 di-trans,poly-cis-decaprenylcistransferase [Allofrancisella guangzhouensis]